MTQVSFYLMQDQQRQVDLACRLCRKTVQKETAAVLVLFDSQQQLERFDALLWQFDPSSFVPHDIDDFSSPICLTREIPAAFQGTCLNLSSSLIRHQQAQRILEIVENNEAAKVEGRQRFKAYRELGLEPVTFKV